MDILSFLRKRGSAPSPSDELLYEFVAVELTSLSVKPGLWTKALSDSNWDEGAARALYVKMRVEQLRNELAAVGSGTVGTLDKVERALACGLSRDDVDYLGTPMKAIEYIEKYRVSKDALGKAIGLGKVRSVLCRGVLWVQDTPWS